MCPRRDLERHICNNLDTETCPDRDIHFFKPCGTTNFPSKLWSSSLPCIFLGTHESFVFQSKPKIKNLFNDIERTIKIKLGCFLKKLTHGNNWWEQVSRFELNQEHCAKANCATTNFLQIEKNQLIELLEHLYWCCNVLPAFVFNGGKNGLFQMKSYLLPILCNERDSDSTVIKNTNQFFFFKYGDIQLLDKMNIFGGATSLDSFLKPQNFSDFQNQMNFYATNGLTILTKCRTNISLVWRILP